MALEFSGGVERSDVARQEARLVAHGPGVPGGFLLDHGADERGLEGVLAGDPAGEVDDFGVGRCRA